MRPHTGTASCVSTLAAVVMLSALGSLGCASDTSTAPGHQAGYDPAYVVQAPYGTTQRPYTLDSPWNTPIAEGALADANSGAMIATILANQSGVLRSDPNQYTYPVYFANASTPRVTMVCSGSVSVNQLDGTRTSLSSRQMSGVPIPAAATASSGTDGQIVVLDAETGDEYDIWRFVLPNQCTNMTRYVAGVHRSAVEKSYSSRGAGVPYFAGLIRPWEIAQGRIEHALAFAYPTIRATRCVWPASKSDGKSYNTSAIPEGARLQLDPALDVNAIAGLDATGRMIARALQQYGAFVIDVGGSNKLYAEDNRTAAWGTTLTAKTVNAIPAKSLRVLKLPAGYWATEYRPNWGKCVAS